MKVDYRDLYLWLANGLRAGLTLPQSFQLAAGEIGPPLGKELQMILQRMERGLSLEESLLASEQELKDPDFSMLVYSILLLKQAGGNFVAHFENLEKILRERSRVAEKVKLLTAQGRMQGIFLGLMPFALGLALFVLSPAYLAPLWETAAGWFMAALIVLMDLGGWLWMRRLAKIVIGLLLCLSTTGWAQGPKSYYSQLYEKRGEVQKIWKDRSPFPKEDILELEGLPPLPLQFEYRLEKTETVLGVAVEKYRGTFSAEAKAELLPLDEAESRISQQLKPFGIEQIQLKGEGWRWIDPKTQKVLAEQIQLEGFIQAGGAPKSWVIHFARAEAEGLR